MSEFVYQGHKCEGNCGATVYVASMRRCGHCAAKANSAAELARPHKCAHPSCTVKVCGYELCRRHYAEKRTADAAARAAAQKAFAESPEGRRQAAARAAQLTADAKTAARKALWAAYQAGSLLEPKYEGEDKDRKLVAGIEVRKNGAQVILLNSSGHSETFVDHTVQKQLETERAAAAKKAEEALRIARNAPKPKTEEKVAGKDERKAAKQNGKQRKAA